MTNLLRGGDSVYDGIMPHFRTPHAENKLAHWETYKANKIFNLT